MSEDNSEHEITINPKRAQAIHVPMSEHRSKAVIEPMPSVAEFFAEGEGSELNEYLNSLDLPDQRIPEVNQKQDFIIKQKLTKEMMAKAKDAAQQAVYKYMSEHPETEGLGFKFTGRVYAEKYKGIDLSLAFTHMLDCMLDRRAGFTTQAAILDSVKNSTSIRQLNANIWTMPLRKFVKTKLRERLKNHGVQIAIAHWSNMSEIRKVIDTYFAKKQAVHKLKLDITITPNEIIVNRTSHKITTVTSGIYKYRKIRLLVNGNRTWLNVDELKVLFGLAL